MPTRQDLAFDSDEVDWYLGAGEEDVGLVESRLIDSYRLSPSQFTEFALFMPVAGEYKKFCFDGREYLRQIYDTPTNRRVIMAGRQVEKCCVISSTYVSSSDGESIRLSEIFEGQGVISAATDARTSCSRVSWVSEPLRKPCVRITTRQGHFVEVATTHPMRLWGHWVEAEHLKPGDRLAVLRRGGLFGTDKVSETHIELAAKAVALDKSDSKVLEGWVFRLSRADTALFLNRLWGHAGDAKQISATKYYILYSSASFGVVRQVRALLWKFGISSSYCTYKVYEDGAEKLYHLIRISTQDGIRRFLAEIGAFGKSEGIVPPDNYEDLKDTYPLELNDLLASILKQHLAPGLESQLHAVGLHKTLDQALSKEELRQYLDFFARSGFNEELVEQLRAHLDTDLFWDEIVSIEDIGEQECIDFSVESTHNFIANGFVTHNSTLLGNQIISYCSLNPGFRALYVSPSHTQTKVFSRDRIKEPIETSKVLKGFTSNKLLANVLEKKFINRSQVTLRFAFLNADRVRGIPTDYVLIDEFQDIILENIPVIEECASHSEYKYFTYSGTPKSLDNPLEFYYRRFSTQNEWVVPCKRHGTPKNPSSWHWNILDEDNIGKKGLICDKCKEEIRPDEDARWAALNPNPNVERPFEGFRIPQLMVPWIEWPDILDKQRKYSRAKFYNEVLGLSYDSGVRPLTMMDVKDNCNPQLSMAHYRKVRERHGADAPIFMGLDWGTGESTFTVMSLGGYMPWAPDIYTIFYIHRFEGPESEPKRQLEVIFETADFFNVALIGVDYGGGFWPNDELLRRYGTEKVKKYQWVGRVKKKISYEPGLTIPRFLCHRTEIMSDIFNAIKRRNVFQFPRWEEFKDPYAADMLNIFSEYNDRLRMNVYKHAPGMPDDSFHSILFGFLASFHYRRRPDVVAPTKQVSVESEPEQPGPEDKMDDLDIEL